ncbi:MAG: hypothetical protein EBX07_02520, partial [Burkholderiaceae bacterium]|nr:hypothetical protein [Burkholderiaceae bacterium]
MIRTALLSVSDKTGIVQLAQALHTLGIKLISTGGTAKLLAQEGLPVTEVASLTNFPEMLDGRVKTLHPKVHGGLLARRDSKEHMDAIAEQGIETIGKGLGIGEGQSFDTTKLMEGAKQIFSPSLTNEQLKLTP